MLRQPSPTVLPVAGLPTLWLSWPVVAPRRETGARSYPQRRTCWDDCRCWRVIGAEAAVVVGADAVASAGEPLGACYPAALAGVEVVHSCRNEAGVPLVRECNGIWLRVKCNNICMQDFSLGSPVACPNPLDGGFKY
jgi:hypothetical protein